VAAGPQDPTDGISDFGTAQLARPQASALG